MGCWHGHGHGYCGPAPRRWNGPMDEYETYEDVSWPRRRRVRGEAGADPGARMTSLEARLDDLDEELRRIETALNRLAGPTTGGASG